jgi:hypothetical protein
VRLSLVAALVAVVGLAACGRAADPAATAVTRAEDATAVRECLALKATLRQPQILWSNGIFALAAEGTPPVLARAITQMEIAVGNSYGPQLSGPTISTIRTVGNLCAAPPIGVTHIRA